MASSGPLGQEYGYFRGIGAASGNSVLPPQAIPKSKKNDKWKETCLDNLEREGLRQYLENLPMSDYYKMVSGDMAYVDIIDDDQDSLYAYVTDFKEEKMNIPSQMKHWDLMFPLVSKIVGEWSMQNDKLRFDTTDEVSTNDYIRERTQRLEKFTQTLFQKELNKMMLLNGMDVSQNFKSEEEYQQFQQQQNQIIQEYFPDKIDQDLKKNFKTEAAQWAEKTWDRDFERFRMNILESMEARDILLVGKSARHYRIGYDYYYPEYWHPIEVFHSKEASVNRLEDCEYVGRIKWYTVSELVNTYGDILSENERKSIYKAYFGPDYTEFDSTTTSYKNVSLLGEGYFEQMATPFKGYSDHKMALEFEAATGIPLSERTDIHTGEVRPSYSMPLGGSNVVGYGATLARHLRNDIEIRTDTIQTTEAYFKGSKKIGLLTYRAINGYLTSTEVDEDILPETLKEYDIKNLRKVSLSEYNILSEEEKENTIIWTDTPMAYRAVKIRVSGVGLQKDIYKLEELPYQIRGEKGNVFDIKLPVCGHIGNSYCKLIRPYQITYNYFMNQTQSYLQKEIGAFFVIDVNAIPTDYFNLPEGDDALIEIRNIAKTTGFLATDFSRNALAQQGGLAFNPMVYNNATFTEPIMRNLQLAEKYKWMAYETLGITPQAMGTPSQYSTVEGIQVGQKAYFAQTHNIDQVLMENKRANVEVHMTVAQYCQLNNKDANYIYMASDNELEFLTTIKDENFSLRQIDVRSTYDAKKNMMFQQLKQALIQNNTMGNDAMSLVELFMSDDFLELKEAARRARSYVEKMEAQKLQSMQEQQSSEQQVKMKVHSDTMELGKEKILGGIEEARIMSLGRAADKQSDQAGIDAINTETDLALKRQKIEQDSENERLAIQKDLQIASQNMLNKVRELDLNKEKLEIEKQKLRTMEYQSNAKNFDSMINKN